MKVDGVGISRDQSGSVGISRDQSGSVGISGARPAESLHDLKL